MNYYLIQHETNPREDAIIGYLNGMLACMGTFNDGPSVARVFEFTKLTNASNDPEQSIMAEFRDWKPELRPVADFYQDLGKTIDSYCWRHAGNARERIERAANIKLGDNIIAEILEATNYRMVKQYFIDALRLLVKENYQAYAVEMIGDAFYELNYEDYFIDCNGVYYFLHFAETD